MAHTAINQPEILQILDINVHVQIINIKKNSTNKSNFTLIFKLMKNLLIWSEGLRPMQYSKSIAWVQFLFPSHKFFTFLLFTF
jgi:hypothetical protein